jgi:hypothetical protein
MRVSSELVISVLFLSQEKNQKKHGLKYLRPLNKIQIRTKGIMNETFPQGAGMSEWRTGSGMDGPRGFDQLSIIV